MEMLGDGSSSKPREATTPIPESRTQSPFSHFFPKGSGLARGKQWSLHGSSWSATVPLLAGVLALGLQQDGAVSQGMPWLSLLTPLFVSRKA